MTPERTIQIRQSYYRARAEVEDVITEAMCETYRNVTGAPPSDRMREALREAIESHNA